MSNATHTPGPWSAPLPYGNNGLEITGDGHTVCVIPAVKQMEGAKCVGSEQRPTAMADARLIAAAPDLLAALEDCVSELEAYITRELPVAWDDPVTNRRRARDMGSIVKAKSALAKARGE